MTPLDSWTPCIKHTHTHTQTNTSLYYPLIATWLAVMETLKTMKTLVERKKESLMNVIIVIVTAADNRQYPFKNPVREPHE